ncbi:hypothetical protein [Candidatus Rhodobacter oscarellae]|uniref:hypothetical protein n=1 Tax=Candidatus Rhodobacter oscarellae TaxID=1675527 RepID=UPI00128F383E|nr:hypothetical protein [Candidatus Rhodobacter lobularis]
MKIRLRIFLSCSLLLVCATTFADVTGIDQGYLFVGTPYSRSNGHIVQSRTTFRILAAGENRVSGDVSHREEMGSFDIVFSIDCEEHRLEAHADVNAGFVPHSAFSFRAFPEWMEVRFPDGEVGSIGADFAAPPAQKTASERFQNYLDANEPNGPAEPMIEGLTNQVISRHPSRLRFIVESMLAKSCNPGAG